MKQTVMWLALALLFAIGVTLSITADSFGPTATAETTGPATLVETPQPAVAETPRPVVIETPRPVVAADAKPAEPEVAVAMLDDAPPRSSIRSDALARWYAEPSASPPTRTTEAPPAPLPLAAATTAAIAGQPAQDSRAGIKPPGGDARPTRKSRDSHAQLPGKRQTANTRSCGSQGRFSDLLRRLNIGSRCSTKRSAA
jgi:soluble lytic murein transglycosylase-like protein